MEKRLWMLAIAKCNSSLLWWNIWLSHSILSSHFIKVIQCPYGTKGIFNYFKWSADVRNDKPLQWFEGPQVAFLYALIIVFFGVLGKGMGGWLSIFVRAYMHTAILVLFLRTIICYHEEKQVSFKFTCDRKQLVARTSTCWQKMGGWT